MSFTDAETRLQAYTRGADLGWAADAMTRQRDEIIGRWLAATSAQDFHDDRPDRYVANHIPPLFDALVAVLRRDAPRAVDPSRPLDDPAVLRAAREHARTRFEQGLDAAQVVTEFRLLRQEIGRALRLVVDHVAPAADVVAAEMLVNDALDGAITLALETLTRHVEEVREDFIATTVHDVQQPLSGIRGYLQLARRDLGRPDADPARVDEMLGHAEDGVDRLRRLLATLADATRLALGRLIVQPTPTGLAGLVCQVIEQLDPEAGGRVRLRADSDEATTADVDPDLLERVVANLLSNAVKYSTGSTPIDVTVRRAGSQVRLSVRDRGIGLTPDEQAGLFRRYARTGRAVARGIEGAGLGLYLSRGIVEAHGGQIWAESAGPDRGTTIHVALPRAVAAPNGSDGP